MSNLVSRSMSRFMSRWLWWAMEAMEEMEEKELPEEELMMEPSSTDFNMGVNMVNNIFIGPESDHCIGYPCQKLPNPY